MPGIFETLHESLQQVLTDRMGWTELRAVQEEAFGAVDSGDDVLVIAPTAGGKTEAALIPVIDRILKTGSGGLRCIYISPLKALINDQEERFLRFCQPIGLEIKIWHGDVPKGERGFSDDLPHILMITPESLEVLLAGPRASRILKGLSVVIVDEVHAFVPTLRGVQLLAVLDRVDRAAGHPVQRTGLSATAGNPGAVLAWLSGGRERKGRLVRVPVPVAEKHFSFALEPDPERRMDAIARAVTGRKAIVFMGSRSEAEAATRALRGRLDRVAIHHSSLSHEIRKEAESMFLSPGSACIVSTSSLELGIDIGELDIVVQAGVPQTVSSFLQRMGRTGRRGNPPFVACIASTPCEMLCQVAIISCASRREVENLEPPVAPYGVLVQQLFLTLVRNRRLSRRRIVEDLRSLAPFSQVTGAAIDRIIDHLAGSGYLDTDGDMIMPGAVAEAGLGRSNWKELYSVIPGGGELAAVTPDGEVVGRLDSRFVGRKGTGSFSLGGRTWKVARSDDSGEKVLIVPGSDGESRTFWKGGDSGLSPLICGEVRDLLAGGTGGLPLPEEVRARLAALSGSLPPGIAGDSFLILDRGGSGKERTISIFTFQGRRFNRLLAVLVQAMGGRGIRVKTGDFAVHVTGMRGAGAPFRVSDILDRIRAMGAEEAGDLIPLPDPSAWKFGALLPDDLFREMVLADYYRLVPFLQVMKGSRTVIPLSGGDPGS